MSELRDAITARQAEITQIESAIEALQRAASIMDERAETTATTTPDQPKTKRKRRKRTEADRKAHSERMKASWAARRRARR